MSTKTLCPDCGATLRIGLYPFCKGDKRNHTPISAARDAEMNEKDATVVFKKRDGTFSYPMENSKPTPAGCERIVLKTLRQIEQHERIANVRSEVAHFDKGAGRGSDDTFNGKSYDA